MLCPIYKPMKTNGTTLYVFPGVAEDKNFETQNENYRMFLSHFVLVNFPKQTIGNLSNPGVFDFENTFAPSDGKQYSTSIAPADFKDQLVESLRNYVANHESTIRNSRIDSTNFYYDSLEPHTTTEKIFWKWCKSLNIVGFEPADTTTEYFGSDSKYNANSSSLDSFKEYLWRERATDTYGVVAVSLISTGVFSIQLDSSSTLKPGDYILINKPNFDTAPHFSTTQSKLLITNVSTTNISKLNDTIEVETDGSITAPDFNPLNTIEIYSAYERFIQFISEIAGVNNVQLPDKAYTEAYANLSYQHGRIPYSLFNISSDNNYKPNSVWPILSSQVQGEIQGGENVNNPLFTNPSLYPGDVWGQFDASGFYYNTQTGNVNKRSGSYYGVNVLTNVNPTLKYPDFDGSTIDGLTLNLNINDYAKAVTSTFPIETFNEFCATSFNNTAPKDFEFNAILWYYTIEDVTGNNLVSATNLYGVQFLDNPNNDVLYAKSKIPTMKKLVSNGYQDGNAYSFALDTNIVIDSDVLVPSFDPDKIYSLFGMELFQEAMMRMTYFNDQLTTLINSNASLSQRINDITGLLYTQTNINSINDRMDNLENLLNVYSTLQIGSTDSIVPRLDTSVNPPLLRLDSVDKQYGYIYHYNTKDMFNEFTNTNSQIQINKVTKTIPVTNGKDFLVVIANNDNNMYDTIAYDTTVVQDKLKIVLDQDLNFKQKCDILIVPTINLDGSLMPYPINDKQVEFYINYNDGTSTVSQLVKTFSLPVLKFKSGTATTQDEPLVQLPYVPCFKVRNVFYSKHNTNDRVFSFVVEDDLINKPSVSSNSFIQGLSRMFIDNFVIQENPLPANLGSFVDLSSQYQVYNLLGNPSYVRANIIDTELTFQGSGLTTTYPANATTILTGLSYGTYTVDVAITTDINKYVIAVELVNANGLTTIDELTTFGDITLTGGDATIKLISKAVTKVSFALNYNLDANLNQILTNYDTVTNVALLPNKSEVNIDKYFKSMPVLTFLKGYKASITRISDVANIPFNNVDQRYNIKIDRL